MKRSRRIPGRILFTLVLVSVTLGTALLAQTEELPLQVGITGSAPQADHKNPTTILGTADIQRLILQIAEEPMERAAVEAAVEGRSFTVEDMVNVGLLRLEGDRYWIDFNLLLVEDQQAILEASERLGRDLAEAFLARRDRFESLAAAHDQPHVGNAELFYIVLGCFSLDWDGLDLTRERGYRSAAQRTIDGQSFTPWAKERGVEVSLRGLYWGSHNQQRAEVTFTTFGDHHALPRFGLPDLLWGSGDAFRRYGDIGPARRAAANLVSAYRGDALDDIAGVMLALADEDLEVAALAARAGVDAGRLAYIFALLEAAGYVVEDDGRYGSSVVVLEPDDADLVRAMMAEGREVMAAWHEANYETLRGQLADLTPGRNGVPFERVYTEVWHFVFAIANRTLVERGFFADPYAGSRAFEGFLPAVWANGLDELG